MLRQEIEAEAVVGLGFHDAPHREETPATAATWHAGHKLQFAALQLCGMSLGLTQTYALVGRLRVCSDDSTLAAPCDLAREIARFDTGLSVRRVVGAFPVAAARELTIRVLLRGLAPRQRSLQIRAAAPCPPRPGDLAHGRPGRRHGPRVAGRRTAFRPGSHPPRDLGLGMPHRATRRLPALRRPKCRDMHLRHRRRTPQRPPPRILLPRGLRRPGARTAAEAEQAVWVEMCRHRLGSYVTNAAGEPLTFWLPDDSVGQRSMVYASRGAQDLVRTGDSSCKGWSDLFREALAIHGIRAKLWIVAPDPDAPGLRVPQLLAPDGKGGQVPLRGVGLLVKGFIWGDPRSTPPRPTHPATSSPPEASPGNSTRRDERCAVSRRPDVARMVGMGHLGRREGMFSEHAVVAVQRDGRDIIYDPTFGLGPR